MKSLLLIACLCALFGGIVCPNTACWTLDQIIAQITQEIDVDSNGILSTEEITAEMIDKWNINNDSCLSFHEFTTNWIAQYHDHHNTAHAFFNSLDLNGDGQLCLIDVAVQIVTYDQNPTDGQIQPSEFSAFMHAVHPDSHQNGGGGHGCN